MQWVFGYGSLMWLPGFECLEKRPAILKGYHRLYGIVSHRNRGTKDNPGMVLSLAPGGETKGLALRFDPKQTEKVLKYLDDREGTGRAHRRAAVPVWTNTGTPEWIPCWTYVPVITYEHYTMSLNLPYAQKVAYVAKGRGTIGTALEYLTLLLDECSKLGVQEPSLEQLLAEAHRHQQAAD
ncbi:MAG TPA: gamma-glutamylcyclotransferase [bacterium]